MTNTVTSNPALSTDQVRLITNLRYADITRGGQLIRTMVAAVLIEEWSGPTRHVVRGFGTDYAWPVFDIRLDCERIDYSVSHPEGYTTPPRGNATITWADGTAITLVADSDQLPLDIADIPRDQIRHELDAKVAKYYSGSNMPILTWMPVARVRALLSDQNGG